MIIITEYSPPWFLGYNIGLELVFAFVALAVSLLGMKVYKLVYQKEVKAISIAFLLVFVSYFLDALFNFINALRLKNILLTRQITLQILTLNTVNMYTHIVLMLLGFLILTLTILKIKNKNISWLLFLLSLTAILASANTLLAFFFVMMLYLLFISGYYLTRYYKHRNTMTGLIASSFLIMLVSTLFFISSSHHPMFYVWGHLLNLGAYLLLLLDFYLVLRK